MFQGATMKKLFVSSAVALALSCGALVAEESGAFVGVGVGYGGAKLKSSGGGDSDTMTLGGLSYEVIAGYKQFFTPEFGLRYYANFAGANTSKTIEGEKQKVNVMNYGVNVDALYNFINDDSLSFGAFLGLGLGMNSWSGDTVKNIKNDLSSIGKVKTSGFDLALNLGVRTEIAKHHGIEVAARVPFLATTLIDKDGIKGTLQQTYNVGARYIFSF